MVGFELWEILTMLTVVLSLASAIMWYSNFQPKQVQNEIALLENQKHIIYNDYVENQSTVDKDFTKDNTTKDCSSDFKNNVVDTSDLDQQLARIQTLQQSLSDLQNEAKQNANILNNQNEIMVMQSSYQNYLSELQDFRQSQFEFKKTSFEIDNIITQLDCDNYKSDTDLQSSLDTTLQNLDTTQPSTNTFKQPLANFITDYSAYTAQPNQLQKLKSDYQTNSNISFDYDTWQKKLKIGSDTFLDSLKSVENREKNLAGQNTELTSKIVYIF